MHLSELVKRLDSAQLHGADIDVSSIVMDSRQVVADTLFACVRGDTVDGHQFAEKAIKGGAVALLVERLLEVDVPQICVADTADAAGIVASALADNPSGKLEMVGITGTNGKTTTSYILESILSRAGRVPAVIGTVNYRGNGKTIDADFTTPTSIALANLLADFQADGCRSAVLEVSSAALSQKRTAGTSFNIAAFSNFTQDHLDYHQTMEEYLAAKTLLFSDVLKDDGIAVINTDDSYSDSFRKAAGQRQVLTVSIKEKADVWVSQHSSTLKGVTGTIQSPKGEFGFACPGLIGNFNVANIALASAIAIAMGISLEAITQGIASIAGVPGRLQPVVNSKGLNIFVDYSHTADALENALRSLRPLTPGRLLSVFGCGGDRDKSKRPLMGAAAQKFSDGVYITSDNPRTEDPEEIISMILDGVEEGPFVHVDRKVAIHAAVCEATPRDAILIAGKGHEDYQILGTQKTPFSDFEVALDACQSRLDFDGKALSEVLETPENDKQFSRVVIDGRTAAPGDLYVAIKGERFDGHQFVQQARDAGANGSVVSKGEGTYLVEDTTVALGKIARFHRRRWGNKPMVAITGSSGKTTTKSILASGLAACGNVHATVGSLNNETGVPLTLLGLRPFHDFAVIEMGMRGLGQISYLTQWAEPTISVITNVGRAHLGVVGSEEGILKGKCEIFERLGTSGIAVFPHADDRIAARAPQKRVTFGIEEGDVHVTNQTVNGDGTRTVQYSVLGKAIEVELQLVGHHQVINAACCLAVASAMNLDLAGFAKGLAKAKAPRLRGEIATVLGRKVMIDCYNANPDSMRASLQAFGEISKSATVVIGDMLELGEASNHAHHSLGRHIAELGHRVIAMGAFAEDVAEGYAKGNGQSVQIARDHQHAADLLDKTTSSEDWILLKASRGLALEKILLMWKASHAV